MSTLIECGGKELWFPSSRVGELLCAKLRIFLHGEDCEDFLVSFDADTITFNPDKFLEAIDVLFHKYLNSKRKLIDLELSVLLAQLFVLYEKYFEHPVNIRKTDVDTKKYNLILRMISDLELAI